MIWHTEASEATDALEIDSDAENDVKTYYSIANMYIINMYYVLHDVRDSFVATSVESVTEVAV